MIKGTCDATAQAAVSGVITLGIGLGIAAVIKRVSPSMSKQKQFVLVLVLVGVLLSLIGSGLVMAKKGMKK